MIDMDDEVGSIARMTELPRTKSMVYFYVLYQRKWENIIRSSPFLVINRAWGKEVGDRERKQRTLIHKLISWFCTLKKKWTKISCWVHCTGMVCASNMHTLTTLWALRRIAYYGVNNGLLVICIYLVKDEWWWCVKRRKKKLNFLVVQRGKWNPAKIRKFLFCLEFRLCDKSIDLS